MPKSYSSLVSAKFRGNSANSNGSTLGNDSAKSSSSHAQSKSNSADLYTDLTDNNSAESSSVPQVRSNSAKSNADDSAESDEET